MILAPPGTYGRTTQVGSISINGPGYMVAVAGTKASAGALLLSGKSSRHTRLKPR